MTFQYLTSAFALVTATLLTPTSHAELKATANKITVCNAIETGTKQTAFQVVIQWGEVLPGKYPLSQAQKALVTLKGPSMHLIADTTFDLSKYNTRCAVGIRSTASLGKKVELQLIKINDTMCGPYAHESSHITLNPMLRSAQGFALHCKN